MHMTLYIHVYYNGRESSPRPKGPFNPPPPVSSQDYIDTTYYKRQSHYSVYVMYTPPMLQSDWPECYNHGTSNLESWEWWVKSGSVFCNFTVSGRSRHSPRFRIGCKRFYVNTYMYNAHIHVEH